MGFGGYNFGALTTVRGIAFRLLEKSSPAQIAETGIKVARVVEEFKDKHPEILRTKPSRGLLDMGPIPLNNFELAFQLCNSDDQRWLGSSKTQKMWMS